MDDKRLQLETQLNDPDVAVRANALSELASLAREDDAPRGGGDVVNLHCHTVYSYNGYGYTPSAFAWKAHRAGLRVAGIVDFDVLDGADEFLEACRKLGLPGTVGLETRVYFHALGDRVINSPGEPGIAYHMGVGFTSSRVKDAATLAEFKQGAQARNRDVIDRVNEYLNPVTIDFEKDVVPLTPLGNATERHLCEAYQREAESIFTARNELIRFWVDKLGEAHEEIERLIGDPVELQSHIRAKTMKRGGVGYVQPDGEAFPRIESMNAFVVGEGAIPTCAWLDGSTEGEADPEALLYAHESVGTQALNIIPERNWNVADAESKSRKLEALAEIVACARARDFPIVVGTEMNAAGLPFADNFQCRELQPFVDSFLRGAWIVYGHTRLQSHSGMGYMSEWAGEHFQTRQEKNAFYRTVGLALVDETNIGGLQIGEEMDPKTIVEKLGV